MVIVAKKKVLGKLKGLRWIIHQNRMDYIPEFLKR